jgi:crotonobetainyl-CoA:carnitine CoA-transferase CaiB-like acyl-CoA transferase
VANDPALAEALPAVLLARGRADWERELTAKGVTSVAVPTGPVAARFLADDEDRAAGYVAEVYHPTLAEHPRLAPTARYSRSTSQALGGVSCDAHTDAVLTELGYAETEIADLRTREVIGP